MERRWLWRPGPVRPADYQLGILAQDRGDYDEAARQYRRALDIFERLGDQAGLAAAYSQLGNLETERGGPVATAVTWHVKALAITIRLGIPQAMNGSAPPRREAPRAWP